MGVPSVVVYTSLRDSCGWSLYTSAVETTPCLCGCVCVCVCLRNAEFGFGHLKELTELLNVQLVYSLGEGGSNWARSERAYCELQTAFFFLK